MSASYLDLHLEIDNEDGSLNTRKNITYTDANPSWRQTQKCGGFTISSILSHHFLQYLLCSNSSNAILSTVNVQIINATLAKLPNHIALRISDVLIF
jgi:hypothetical protein